LLWGDNLILNCSDLINYLLLLIITFIVAYYNFSEIFMRVFILSILTLFVFNANAASTTEFLDSYEEVVDIYVSYADKSQFCNSDNMELLTKVMPKLTQFGQEAQNIQGSFNSDELQRYLLISQKFSTSMQKLSTKMQNISC
jgi:hypothetical protein